GKMGFLQGDADALAQLVLVPIPAHAEDLDLTRGRRVQALEDLDGGGLAGTVRTEEPEAFPRAHLEVEAVDGSDLVIPLDEAAAENGGLCHRFRGRAISMVSTVSFKARP